MGILASLDSDSPGLPCLIELIQGPRPVLFKVCEGVGCAVSQTSVECSGLLSGEVAYAVGS